ncbi:MAG: DUF1844 domain-containing protein [Armatimonadetes bacterium]|nr:DUF1844 domain-containing protein [Armatimonadota bacterium]
MPPEERDDELEEEQYVKADRRASRGTEEDAPPAAEPTDGAAATESDAAAEEDRELPDITVYSLLRMSIGMYIEQAWVHLGVRMDPSRNKVEQNLPYAKIAIDTVEFMARQLQPDLDESERKDLELVLANLRMNYVQRA